MDELIELFKAKLDQARGKVWSVEGDMVAATMVSFSQALTDILGCNMRNGIWRIMGYHPKLHAAGAGKSFRFGRLRRGDISHEHATASVEFNGLA